MRVFGDLRDEIIHADPPAWVHVADVPHDAAAPAKNTQRGVLSLLDDLQHNLEERVSFHRQVNHLLTLIGVQEGSRYEIEFDPQYDQITLHSLELKRAGQTIDLLSTQDVHVLNREEGLEAHVLDGRLKAVLLLEDTRAGDIVDFSYSIRSKAERFQNEPRQGRFLLRGPACRQWIRRRILYSTEREIFALPTNYEREPEVIVESNGLTSCEWNERDPLPLEVEDNIPTWIDPFSSVQYGEHSTWKQVIEWATPIYAIPQDLPPALWEEIRRIQETTSTPEERISAALQFVQDHIRYVSVCLGEHTYKPHDLVTVLKRRYGDCKDKSLLLVAVLHALGIDAALALVNTVRRQQVAEMLPGIGAFDHAIARVNHNGRTYWIDPVMTGQRGALNRLHCPEYGKALVIAPGAEDLEDVKTSGIGHRTKNIDEFSCGRVNQLTEYRALQIFEGAAADAMRLVLTNNTEQEIARINLHRLLPLYPGIEIARPWNYFDNEKENCLKLQFEYLVKDLWKPIPNQSGGYFAEFPCLGVTQYLYRPLSKKRLRPFAVNHPVTFEQHLDVKTARSIPLDHQRISIQCPIFECLGYRQTRSNLFHLDFRYTSRKDHVAPKEVEEYIRSCENLSPLLGQMLLIQ